MKIMVMTW